MIDPAQILKARGNAAWAEAFIAEAPPSRQRNIARVYAKRTLADLDAALNPEPPPVDPEPSSDPTGWKTIRTLSKVSDWKGGKLIEGFSGASITDTPQGMRFYIPGHPTGERCEVQDYFGKEGMVCAYEWTFMIPAAVNLSTLDDKENLIHQGHANERGGFTSGTSIDGATDRIKVKVKGGHETSLAGSHRYEYEDEFEFGTIERGKMHRIRHEVHWHRSSGFYRARLDDGGWNGVTDVPTWPLGDKDGAPTSQIMVRTGFYPHGPVPAPGMEMFCGPMVLQEAV